MQTRNLVRMMADFIKYGFSSSPELVSLFLGNLEQKNRVAFELLVLAIETSRQKIVMSDLFAQNILLLWRPVVWMRLEFHSLTLRCHWLRASALRSRLPEQEVCGIGATQGPP